ncbi:MAG TPA: hypothetical protein VHZ30_03905 [Verrucomicrobiae bacterium]|jgi:hypothetical protein|nr:hypothetical protein [Verrucomicrobiae bacterium]
MSQIVDPNGNPVYSDANPPKPHKHVIEATITLSNVPPTGNKEENTNKWYQSTETKRFWLDICLFTVAIVGAVIYFKQMRAAENQLDVMQKENVLDQRAWVYPAQFLADTTSGLCTFRVSFKNTGKTPALNANAYIAWTIATNAIPATDDQQNAQMRQTMPPNTEIFLNTPTVPKSVLDTVTNGAVQCWVIGTVWYDDIFTNHHWDQFCYLVEPDLRFAGTRLHHASDRMSGGDGKNGD